MIYDILKYPLSLEPFSDTAMTVISILFAAVSFLPLHYDWEKGEPLEFNASYL